MFSKLHSHEKLHNFDLMFEQTLEVAFPKHASIREQGTLAILHNEASRAKELGS